MIQLPVEPISEYEKKISILEAALRSDNAGVIQAMDNLIFLTAITEPEFINENINVMQETVAISKIKQGAVSKNRYSTTFYKLVAHSTIDRVLESMEPNSIAALENFLDVAGTYRYKS